MNLCNIGATVAAGCPQGGVLSSLLWCLLVDDLLSDLRRAGFYAQGYAGDITIMVSGRFEGVRERRAASEVTIMVYPPQCLLLKFGGMRCTEELKNDNQKLPHSFELLTGRLASN
ncbi:hypothetical protein Trydic_g16463 [Trypoxylus dichotomus]